MRTAAWAMAASTLALAACDGRLDPAKLDGPDRELPASGSAVVYGCDDGSVIQATFEGVLTVHLVTDRFDRVLPSVMSETGAKYKLATTVFRVEGDRATLETESGTTECTRRV